MRCGGSMPPQPGSITSTRRRSLDDDMRTSTTSPGPAPPCWTAFAISSLSTSATRCRSAIGRAASIEMTERRAIAAAPVPPGIEKEVVFASIKGQVEEERPARTYMFDRTAATLGALRRRGGVVTQRPAKPFTPVRFRSSPLRRGPVRTVAVFGGNSEIALAIVEALARDDDLERVVLAVRDPANAPGRAPLEAHSIDAATVAFDADATATHKAATEEVLQALDGQPLDLAIVAFARLGDQEQAKRDAAAAAQLATTNFTGAVSVLTILAERMK